MSSKALAGVKVLEYAQFVSGPYCGKLLADLGAEVIKIEEPGVGDEARRRGPFSGDNPDPEQSILFLYLNTNKLGVALKVETAEGQRIFKELIKEVDILVEDNAPGVMEKLGLDYESLKQINPRLIMTSITPFGQTGPYRDYKAYHLNTYHGGGVGYFTPSHSPRPFREPLGGGGFLGEYGCGLFSAVATLGALYFQQATGLGQRIDISKQEAIIGLCRTQIARYPNEGAIPSRVEEGGGFGRLLPCKDGHVIVMSNEVHEWRAFVKLLGDPEWADKRYEDVDFRVSHYKEISPFVHQWLMNHTKEEIFHQGQALACPVASVRSAEDIVDCEQMKGRNFFVEVDHPRAGKGKYPSAPYLFSQTPVSVESPAPLLGQHNEEVYCRRLGYSQEELARLRAEGII